MSNLRILGNPAGTCPAPYTTIGSVCLQYLVEAGELNFADSVKFCMLNGGSGIQTFDKAGGYVDTSNGELDNILVLCLQCLSMPRVHDLYWLKIKFYNFLLSSEFSWIETDASTWQR
jgi:hypothetical protein